MRIQVLRSDDGLRMKIVIGPADLGLSPSEVLKKAQMEVDDILVKEVMAEKVRSIPAEQ